MGIFDKYEALQAKEKVMLAQSRVLIKTHSEVYQKLLNEEHQRMISNDFGDLLTFPLVPL